ncbi:MAG: orotidine-5'-phosphate decarboxylase [Lentisphaeria bacterium]|nr:orotidine-5'-phosphate decarboxylase [Lentisphaeria bacterium]
MKFYEKLAAAWEKTNSLVCVGLDPDLKKLPPCLQSEKYPIFRFNQAIIDATKDHACCYKPQAAYYAGQSADEELLMTMEYLKKVVPETPVILDAKRADIGNTTAMYALEAFQRYKADAVTVNPYMGMDALKPFLDYADKGVVVLCRTSNKGAKEIQEMILADGRELYKYVASLIAGPWNYNNNTMLVAGATFPEELGEIRRIVGNTPLLVPGIGAQGGDLEGVLKNGLTPEGTGLVINSSRGIIYASSGTDFAERAGEEALKLKNAINAFR